MNHRVFTAAFAVVVPDALVQKVVGKELYKAFKLSIDSLPVIGDDGIFVDEHSDDMKIKEWTADCIDEYRDYVKLRKKVISVFKAETGLMLSRKCHNSEDYGSENDDIEGSYWALDFDKVFQQSKALESLNQRSGKKQKVFMAKFCSWR